MRKTQIFLFIKYDQIHPPVHSLTAPIFKFEVSIESYNFIKKKTFFFYRTTLFRTMIAPPLIWRRDIWFQNQSLFYEEQKSKRGGFVKSDEHPLLVRWHKTRN